MALKVWFESDVRSILAGVGSAAALLPNADTPEDQAYVRGFQAALSIVATSFGVADEAETKTINAGNNDRRLSKGGAWQR